MAYAKFGGMIQPVAFSSVVPSGWLRCDGQAISRTTYADLFTLIGTTFGIGDGSTTFNVPNLLSRAVEGAAIGLGYNPVGTLSGEALHILTTAEMPSHTHTMQGVTGANGADPTARLLGDVTSFSLYATSSDGTNLNMTAVSSVGDGIAHETRQPYLGITYLIATDDVDPDYATGEMRLVTLASAPTNWHLCDGSSLTAAGEPNLFAAIGYTYGGSGANFNLPDMRARIPVHTGTGPGLSNYALGSSGGTATVTLTTPQIPAHKHIFYAAAGRGSRSNVSATSGNLPSTGISGSDNIYAPASGGSLLAMGADAIRNEGGSGAHNNLMPMAALTYIIALAQ